MILFLLILNLVLVKSLPPRIATEEDIFFHSLLPTEKAALLSLATKLRIDASSTETITLPPEILRILQQENAPENFFQNLVSWIVDVWGLTDIEAGRLLKTGRACRGSSCLNFNDISNYCCPFGK